jgi:hypothetical protein
VWHADEQRGRELVGVIDEIHVQGFRLRGQRPVVMSKKIVKDELRKSAATFFNNIAVGCVLLGLIGPMAAGKFARAFTPEFVYTEGAAWVLAAAFHMIARRQLRFLEE